MLSVSVAHSYFLRFDEKQLRRARPYPPLATLQVAARLSSGGSRIHVFDAMLAEGEDEYGAHLHAVAPDLAIFYEDNYNYLSKMCLGRMRQATHDMIAQAKRANIRVIVAGSDASDDPASYLAAGADAVLLGEGLQALRILVDRFERDSNLNAGPDVTHWVEGLAGVASLHEGK